MKYRSIKDIDNFVPKKGSFKHTLRKMQEEKLQEKWSDKYKKSINCSNPKGFSQKAHCAGKKKNEEAAGVGIITKQNATKDVPVGGEYMNVKKLGLGKGKPKQHSKKVKGSKTNVLYNLGMVKEEKRDTHCSDKCCGSEVKREDCKCPPDCPHCNCNAKIKLKASAGTTSPEVNAAASAQQASWKADPSFSKESVDKPDPDMLQYIMLEAKVGELSKASEIYVDMDGVLADFFGEWAKIMKVDHYSKIDNVDINDALQKIRDTEEFWLKLPLLPQAKSLLALIKKIKGSYTICSSPLADDPRSEPHKREWIKKNLSFFPPKQVIITSDKAKYATQSDGTPNILIDDFGKNVNAWEAAGGEGFKYKDHKFERTAKELQQHLQQPATERELTKGEEKEKERIVKGMKKKKGDFKDRYGKDAEAVMYATATKLAKEGKHIPNPKNAFLTKADTAYDFIKIGTNMANLKSMPTGVSNYDEPDIMIAPYAGKKEMKYLQKELKRLGYKVQDADGYQDAHYDDKATNGEEPPQVKNEGRLGRIKLSKLRPVHKKRKYSKLFNQLKRIGEDNLSPLTIDKHGHIVNGHHRYDALRLINAEYAPVRMLDVHVAETLSENFADGKKKGKSRPGRVKKSGASCSGSVTKLRKMAKKYSGERAKMYHWCANMKSGKKKK